MNLEDQKLIGVGELVINDSLNAPLLELQVKRNSTTIVPTTNDLIVYVDKESSTTPTENRREYVFNLSNVLQSDEVFKMSLLVKDNDIVMNTTVTRLDGTVEDIDTLLICLFEGNNCIYTNYSGADIEVIYPKNNDMNKYYLNNAIYANHKYKNKSDFSLDDIYFKDAFTKEEDKLNLEINNITTDCITSKNNKFSLDESGNLTVNSLICNNNSAFDILNAYPVGSVYISNTNNNPATYLGGTWELVDKEFTPSVISNCFTNNATNTTSNNIIAIRTGHCIEVTGSFVNKVKIGDVILDLGTISLATLGITGFPTSNYLIAVSDTGNSGIYARFTSEGLFRSFDCITGVEVASGSTNYFTVVMLIPKDYMIDSACNKFYWKRVA